MSLKGLILLLCFAYVFLVFGSICFLIYSLTVWLIDILIEVSLFMRSSSYALALSLSLCVPLSLGLWVALLRCCLHTSTIHPSSCVDLSVHSSDHLPICAYSYPFSLYTSFTYFYTFSPQFSIDFLPVFHLFSSFEPMFAGVS